MDIQRIYALHDILRSRVTAVSTGDLTDALGCSRSTLHRTINHLKADLGAPISNAPRRGYFYDRSKGVFELPGLWFGSDELAALLVMDHSRWKTGRWPTLDHAQSRMPPTGKPATSSQHPTPWTVAPAQVRRRDQHGRRQSVYESN